jgi:ribosome maturation factor RimP
MSETYDLFQQGRAHLRKGRAAQATVALEKAKRREPDKASIREALGIAYFRLARWQEAEQEFRTIVEELQPTDDYAHYALGRTLELTGKDRFCVFVDHPQGVNHALCERVTGVLRPYLDEYGVEVSSPGLDRPLRTRAHFERAVGRTVRVKTETGRARGTVVSAGERSVRIENGASPADIPYDQIVRANLIDEGKKA